MKIYDIRINTACDKKCGWFGWRTKYVEEYSNQRHEIKMGWCKLFAEWLCNFGGRYEQDYRCKQMCDIIEKEPEGEFEDRPSVCERANCPPEDGPTNKPQHETALT